MGPTAQRGATARGPKFAARFRRTSARQLADVNLAPVLAKTDINFSLKFYPIVTEVRVSALEFALGNRRQLLPVADGCARGPTRAEFLRASVGGILRSTGGAGADQPWRNRSLAAMMAPPISLTGEVRPGKPLRMRENRADPTAT